MDVAVWLRTLGLEQYETLFRQNDIDAEVLPTLGVDDLRELGISSLGHRKKLLERNPVTLHRIRLRRNSLRTRAG